MENKELTGRIIGAAITVHKALGPGYLEEVYEEAMAIELDHLGIKFERQKSIPIIYREKKIKDHRLDFLIEKLIVLEIKAVAELEAIFFAIVRSYLKITNLQDGLLINFSTMPLTVKRVGREDSSRKNLTAKTPVPEFLIS
jgi:GxxExxY protein